MFEKQTHSAFCILEREREREKMLSTEKYEFDPSYRGQTGSSIGISTVGFRSNKYNPNEWHENNYAKYYQLFTDRDASEKQRWQATRTEQETLALQQQTQSLSTKKLQQRSVYDSSLFFFLLTCRTISQDRMFFVFFYFKDYTILIFGNLNSIA